MNMPARQQQPAKTPKRVVVNAPAFRMDLFEGGELVKSYKIGIGYPEFPLPTGLRKADTIIFNPTWTPPDEPWVESPGSKVKVGEKIEAGDKLNPLGPIKIPIGLPSLIHGGKAPAKLGSFASHGCVGLTSSQIQDFAKRLGQLGGTQISDEQIAEYQKNKTETKSVKLNKAVPVELRYETITVEDGKLHIYRDVYDRGTNTDENLRNVLQQYGVTLDQLSDSKRAVVTRALGQMARDAGGKPVPDATANKSDGAKGNSSRKGDKSKEESKANNIASGKVTRTIKGGKKVVVEIPALLGKGYPAPVDLFHWQSQSTTSAKSRTGQRYIHHRARGSSVLLFVRESKSSNSLASPYTFLGAADFVSHEGSRPMSIVWRLHHKLPARLLRRVRRLAI